MLTTSRLPSSVLPWLPSGAACIPLSFPRACSTSCRLSEKSTYLGLLTFAGLMLAIIVQPIAGAISDRSGFSWGRRRPFILGGTLVAMLFLAGIGWVGSFLAIFVIYCLLQIASNTTQGPYQAFIPDLVPEGRGGWLRGSRASWR